jgi:hypothetical protein
MSEYIKPLVDVYGSKPVDAATFGKGAQSVEQIEQATDARRSATESSAPRDYDKRQ